MIISMKEMLDVAFDKKFAVGAFNITDSLLFSLIMDEAEDNNAPVIIQLAPPEMRYVDKEFFAYVLERMTNSSVPCVLHLDHGKNQSDCLDAIQLGFNSVMIDASDLPYEENVALTKTIVKFAHEKNVHVEGEIGTIGANDDSVEGGSSNIVYTNPHDVTDFVKKTGVDSLAIAIGTAHGLYPKGHVPKLRIDLLKDIRLVTPVPLVLHGGSSNNDNEIRESILHGITKINIASDYRFAFFEGVRDTLTKTKEFWGPRVYVSAISNARNVVKNKMSLFGSLGRGKLYE